MTKQDRIERYRATWMRKTPNQVRRELESYRRYLSRHRDGFFQEQAPDEMTDGDRVVVLREVYDAIAGVEGRG